MLYLPFALEASTILSLFALLASDTTDSYWSRNHLIAVLLTTHVFSVFITQ